MTHTTTTLPRRSRRPAVLAIGLAVLAGCANSRPIWTPQARLDEPQIERYESARPRFGERLRRFTNRVIPGDDEPPLDDLPVIQLGPEDVDAAASDAESLRSRSSRRVSFFDPRD